MHRSHPALKYVLRVYLQITPSLRLPSRPPKIIWNILTPYFYSIHQRKARDGLGFDLTCAQVVGKCANNFVFYDHFFCITIILTNLTHIAYCNVLNCTFFIVLYCIVLHYMVQFILTLLYRIVMYCTVFYCIFLYLLYSSVFYCIVLYYTVWHSTAKIRLFGLSH